MALKSNFDNYEDVLLGSTDKPRAGHWTFWKTLTGFLIRDASGKDILLDKADQAYAAGSTSTSPISHAAIAAIVDKLQPVEALVAPTVADLSKPWSAWFHYIWDMPNLKATVWEYKRSPISNDILPNPIPWEISVPLTPRVNTDGTSTLTLPQSADFTYTPSRSAQSNQATFTAGVLSNISYQYMTATGTALKTGQVSRSVALTDTSAALGIVAAPATATSVQITFAYISGGSLTYNYALP